MKLLTIICVLFALTANAQKDSSIFIYYKKQNTSHLIYRTDSNNNFYYNTKGIKNTILILYSDYQQICYADSFIVTYDYYKHGTDTFQREHYPQIIDPAIEFGYIETSETWQHRQPTFEGFMEFLKTTQQLNN